MKAASGLRVGRLRERTAKLMETLGATGLQVPPGSFLSPVVAELDPLLLMPCPDDTSSGRWHRSSPQMSSAGCSPSRAHPQLLPPSSGWPKGDGSICKTALSTFPGTPRPPQPHPKPPLCSSSCSQLSSVAQSGLPCHPRAQGQARRPQAGFGGGQKETQPPHKRPQGCRCSAGRLWESSRPMQWQRGAGGTIWHLTARFQRPLCPREMQGTAGQQTLPHFTAANGSRSPRHHPRLGCV